MLSWRFIALSLALAGPCLANVEPITVNEQATALDRLKIIPDANYVFDFFNPPGGESKGKGGHTVSANADTFPAVIGNGVAMTLGFLDACGLNTPHVHNRATEFNLAVNGTLGTGVFQENNGRLVTQILKPGQATLFPQGAIHFEQNLGCEPMVFVAAFGSADPGVLQVAQGLIAQLPEDIVLATLGDVGITYLPELASKIPANIAQGTEECLKRCGITRQPSSVSYTAPAHLQSASNFVPAAAAAAKNAASFEDNQPFKAAAAVETTAAAMASSNNGSSNTPLLIALIVINALLAVGLMGLASLVFLRRRPERTFSQVNNIPSFAATEYKDPYDSTATTPRS